jgi:hypothetical protein
MRLLEPGEVVPDASGRPVLVGKVEQRNWSRVAVAAAPGVDQPEFFLKQFVTADGRVLVGGSAAEAQAAALGRATFGDCVLVPEFGDEDRALLAYPYRRFLPTHELLRSDPRGFNTVWPQFCEDIAGIIAAATRVPAARLSGLRDAARSRSDTPRALAFKALEVRNIAPRVEGKQPLLLFDLGPAHVATAGDVAARLLVSVLLLNWGRPMSRFVKGPPIELAGLAARQWSGYLDGDTVASALTKEVAMRRTTVQAASRQERWAKSVGIMTVGRRYERQSMSWVRRTLS